VLYTLTLTVVTHWPALALGTESRPAPDKLLHMIAFGGLVALLWQTRWCKAPWHVVVLVLVWAAVDEASQGLPALHRTVTWQDMAAGQLGVLLVAAGWWALSPVGGPANRARLAFHGVIIADLFTRARTWMIVTGSAIAAGLVIGAVGWLVMQAAPEAIRQTQGLVVTALVGAAAGALFAMTALGRNRASALAETRPCFVCATSCRVVDFDDSGHGRCPSCDAPVHFGQWALPMQLPMRAALRGAGPAALLTVGLIVGAVALHVLVLVLGMHVTSAKRLHMAWQSLTPDMRFTVDLALVGAAVAAGLRLYRRRQGRLCDRQHLVCRRCGHDLTGAPLTRGLGVCSECGASFVRIADDG
jgi:hypothetical protein